MTHPQTEQQWLDTYLDALPDTIRPTSDDRRFLAAAAAAYRHGWTGTQAANAITRRNYTDKLNPVLVAIMELERISERPPHIATINLNPQPHDCIACPPTATWTDNHGIRHPGCPNPVTQRIPADWTRERFQLLNELMRTPDLDEDEREDAMRTLIHHQHAR